MKPTPEAVCRERAAVGNVHASRESADYRARVLTRRTGNPAWPYRCACCKRFHVGSVAMLEAKG